MAFGILTSFIWSLLVAILSIISFWFIPVIFFLTIIGAFLPDLDSDSGIQLNFTSMPICNFGGNFFILYK